MQQRQAIAVRERLERPCQIDCVGGGVRLFLSCAHMGLHEQRAMTED